MYHLLIWVKAAYMLSMLDPDKNMIILFNIMLIVIVK